MADTYTAAFIPIIQAAFPGAGVFRQEAPEQVAGDWWITIEEDIATRAERGGDAGAGDTYLDEIQIDLWQQWRDPAANAVTEDPSLARRLRETVHGALLQDLPFHVYSVRALTSVRLLERDNNVVHHAITVDIRRGRTTQS